MIPTIYRTIKRFEKQEKVQRKIGSGKNRPFHRPNFTLAGRNKQWVVAQNRIVIWGGRSKFITTLSKSILQRWEPTAKPKNPHLKPQHINNTSAQPRS
jgi:hypothetical protein